MCIKGSRFIAKVKAELTTAFFIVNIGFISFFFSLKIEGNWEKKTIKLFKPGYIDKIFEKYHLKKANSINTLIRKSELWLPRTDGKVTFSRRETYQEIIRLPYTINEY